MLSTFNCNTLGWKTIPFIFIYIYIQLAFVPSNRSPVCFYVLVQDVWLHFLLPGTGSEALGCSAQSPEMGVAKEIIIIIFFFLLI